MEHLPSNDELQASLDAARTMLLSAPDGQAACQGFEVALAEEPSPPASIEAINAAAARQLKETLAPHWANITDDLRSRVLTFTWLDREDRLSVVQRTRGAMRSELRRAAKQLPSDDDLFLRATSEAAWPAWTQQLLWRYAPPPPLPAVEDGSVHPALSDEHYEALRQGNLALFIQLSERCRPTIVKMARDRDVEPLHIDDIVAQATAKAQRGITGLIGEHTHSFYRWMNQIASNVIADHVDGERTRRQTLEHIEHQVAEHHRLVPDEMLSDDGEHVDPIDPKVLRAIIDTVINSYLAPPPAGIDAAATRGDGPELAEDLISPALATRKRDVAQEHRAVLAAAIGLLRSLGTPTPATTAREPGERKASTPTRTGVQGSQAAALDLKPSAGEPAKKNTGGKSHAARRRAPDVLFTAQRGLRAWLDDTAEQARSNSEAMAIWSQVWRIERQQLIAQLEAISEQFAGALSTFKVLATPRLIALENWARTLLEELGRILEVQPEQHDDDARFEADEPNLEALVQLEILATLDRCVERFEKPKKPDSSGIDAHHRGLEKLQGSRSTDDKARQALRLAISHYMRLREAYDEICEYRSSTATSDQEPAT